MLVPGHALARVARPATAREAQRVSVARWSPTAVREDTKARRALARATRFRQAAVMTFVLSWIALSAFSIYPSFAPVFLGLPVASLCAIVCSSRSVRRSAEEVWAHDTAIIDEFHHDRSWLVELIVRQGEAPTGTDRGMLWIENDRLYFNGALTSFGLTSDQAVGECHLALPLPGIRHGIGLSLRRGSPLPVSLSISPVVPAKWQGKEAPNELRAAIDAWVRMADGIGGQLPPLDLGPFITSERRLRAGALVASEYWAVAALTFLKLGLAGAYGLALPFGTLGVLLGLFGTPFRLPELRWKAWRDRCRLERGH